MKYIIDIPDEYENDYISMSPVLGKEFCYPIRNMNKNKTYVIPTGLKIEPYTEPDQQAVKDEVWEFVRKIVIEMECSERYDCFGDDNEVFVIGTYSYKEVKEKYEAWLKNKDEICVGDEVIPLDTQYNTMVVTKLWVSEYGDEWVDTIADDGKMYSFLKTSINKTGRHFDGVEKLLKEMREETE